MSERATTPEKARGYAHYNYAVWTMEWCCRPSNPCSQQMRFLYREIAVLSAEPYTDNAMVQLQRKTEDQKRREAEEATIYKVDSSRVVLILVTQSHGATSIHFSLQCSVTSTATHQKTLLVTEQQIPANPAALKQSYCLARNEKDQGCSL